MVPFNICMISFYKETEPFFRDVKLITNYTSMCTLALNMKLHIHAVHLIQSSVILCN